MSEPIIFLSGKELAARSSGTMQWVLEPFGVAGSVCMLYGRQGVGKSRLMLQLGHALATGGDWLGFPTYAPGRVAYVNLDMGEKEFEKMWADATLEGIVTDDMAGTAKQLDINLLKPADRNALLESVETIKARHVLLDTGPRCYRPVKGADIGDEIRNLIRAFQQLTPEGLSVFTQHDRKPGVYQKMDEFEADDNAYSGPAAWETAVTSSWRLTERAENKVKFWVKKHRLGLPPIRTLMLNRDLQTGFFQIEHDYQFDLKTWPKLVPNGAKFQPASRMDVFRDVAQRHGVSVDTVRKYHARTRDQVSYLWDVWDMGHSPIRHVPDLNGDEAMS